jgi:hypothetical protein
MGAERGRQYSKHERFEPSFKKMEGNKVTKLLYKKRKEREIKGGGKREQVDECRARETERGGKVREGGKVHEGGRERER